MSTSINVSVETARLINSSRQQTAANRVAFQDKQARARAEEKGLVLREANRLLTGLDANGRPQYGVAPRPPRRRNDPAANRRPKPKTVYGGYFAHSTGPSRHTFKVRSGVLAQPNGPYYEAVEDSPIYANQSRVYNLSYQPGQLPSGNPYFISSVYQRLWQEAATGPAWVPGSVGQPGWKYEEGPTKKIWIYQIGYTVTAPLPYPPYTPQTIYYIRYLKLYNFLGVSVRTDIVDRHATIFFDSLYRLSGTKMPRTKFLFYFGHRHTTGSHTYVSGDIITEERTFDSLGNELSYEQINYDATADAGAPNVTVELLKKFEVASDPIVPSLFSLVEKSNDLPPSLLAQFYEGNFGGYPGASPTGGTQIMSGLEPDYNSGDYQTPGGPGND